MTVRSWLALACALIGCGCAGQRELVAHAGTIVAADRAELAVAIEPHPIEPHPIEPLLLGKAASLELTFVGDLVVGRYLADDRYVDAFPGGVDPLAEVRSLLAADLVFGNLESPVVFELPQRSPSRAKHRFAGDPTHVAGLADAGFTVLSLANNHFFDLGVAGQRESPQVLREAGITAVGTARVEPPWIRVETVYVQGWRIGFVAFMTRVGDRGDPDGPRPPLLATSRLVDEVLPHIRAARSEHDLLIASAHWGIEYADEPGRTRELVAHHLLAAGVDLVIGHHPHVLQAIERHPSTAERDGLIAYSLRNFLFHRGDHPPGLSGVLRVRYEAVDDARPCLSDARLHPVTMVLRHAWMPAVARDSPAAEVRERVASLSQQLGTTWQRDGRRDDAARSEDLVLAGLRACPAHEP